MINASEYAATQELSVIWCPSCLGRGNDGLGCFSTTMTAEDILKNYRDHKCRTCDGSGKMEVIIVGPAK